MQQIAHERLILGFETILGRVPVLERTRRRPGKRRDTLVVVILARGRRRHGRSRRDVLILSRATKQRRHLFRLERPRGRAREVSGNSSPSSPSLLAAGGVKDTPSTRGPSGERPSAKTPPATRGGVLFSGVFPIPTSRAGSVFFSGVSPISTRAGPPPSPGHRVTTRGDGGSGARSRSSSPSRPRRARASSDPT